METISIQDGRWTRKIRYHKDGVWWGLILDEWITYPAYKEAKLVLEGGPTVLISAADLQRIFVKEKFRSKPVEVVVDPAKGTLNGHLVEMRREI